MSSASDWKDKTQEPENFDEEVKSLGTAWRPLTFIPTNRQDIITLDSFIFNHQKLSHAWLRGRQRPDNKTLSTFPSLQLSSIHTLGNKSKEEEDIIIEREKVGQVFCVLKVIQEHNQEIPKNLNEKWDYKLMVLQNMN